MPTTISDAADMSEPILRRRSIVARSDGNTMRVDVETGDENGFLTTDEPREHGGTGGGPSPLRTVLGALCGCENVTFNRTAAEMDFAYDGIRFEAGYSIDIRGRMGDRSVRRHYQSVRLRAVVTTTEGVERLREVVAETEARCPVFNLITDAGVRVEAEWVREDPVSA